MRHHHKNGLLLLALVALVLWWVFRKHSETTAATGKAGGTGGTVVTGSGSGSAAGGTVGRSSSVGAVFVLPSWKLNQSPLKYNEFQMDFQHSLDFYTQMYFPFGVDSSTGMGVRGSGSGYASPNRFWQITSDKQLVRA